MGHRKKDAGRDYLNVKIPVWLPKVDELIEGTGLKRDRFLIVIHQFYLCWLHANKSPNRKKMHILANGYFSVSSDILRQVATDRYLEYVELLVQLGVVEKKTNHEGGSNYSPGFHSQLYRFLLPDVTGAKLKFRDEKVTDYRTIKSVLRKRDRYRLEDADITGRKNLLPIHQTLKRFILDTTIDLEVAVAIEQKLNPNFATDAYAELDMLHLETICNGDGGFFLVDSFGERVHTHFTNLAKRFRPAIRFKGYEEAPLVCIDIKCSQPYFSSILTTGRIFDELLPEFHPMRNLIEELSAQPDYRQYRYLCETGKFNTYLGNMRGLDPAVAKIEFFKAVIYAKRKIGSGDVAMRNEFRRFFPGVYKFFMAAKRLTENDLPELKYIIEEKRGKYRASNNSHKILPCMMQRAESRVVYQYIAPRMLSEGIQPFLTLHDAFYVLPIHVEQTINIIEESFKELGVIPPMLDVKVLE